LVAEKDGLLRGFEIKVNTASRSRLQFFKDIEIQTKGGIVRSEGYLVDRRFAYGRRVQYPTTVISLLCDIDECSPILPPDPLVKKPE